MTTANLVWHLIQGDSIQKMKGIEDESIDLILTDPPYPQKYQHLYGEMAVEAKRILKVGGSLVTLCGHYQVLDVGQDIKEHLRFWWICGMEHTVLKRLAGKWVCVRWKPALWFVKERRRKGDTECPIDLLKGDKKDKEFHEWGQPVNWFHHWVERLCPEGGIVLDPFMGGGTTGVPCLLLNRGFIGMEIDPEVFETARLRLNGLYDKLNA